MKAIKENNEWRKYAKIPNIYLGVIGYQYATDRHYNDGWRDIVPPNFNPDTHKQINELEEIGEHPNKVVTYKVVALTQAEINQRNEELIPLILTRSQLRRSLILNGISEANILNAINSLPSPQKEFTLIMWEDEQNFTRTSPEVQGIKTIMGLTEQELNNIFIQGANL